MEIKRASNNSIKVNGKKKVSTKSEFSENFNSQRDKSFEDQMNEAFQGIKKKGKVLSSTKSMIDVSEYKNMVKEYLKHVLNYMYNVKKNTSFWQSQYYVTVEVVDSKLEELTKSLLEHEKGNINIANKVDEIAGLLIDIYK
ncbi:MAG: YaaR family protein [Clostridiaceae bacterium]